MTKLILIAGLLATLVFTASADRRRLMMVRNASAPAPAPITFISASTNYLGVVTVANVSVPAGVQAGDTLIAFLVTDSDSTLTGLDTGWSESESNSMAAAGFHVCWKIADGTEGSTDAFTFSGGETTGATMLCYRNASGSAPFDGDAIETGAPGAGVDHITALLTPSVNNSMLIGCIFIDPTSVPTFTPVSGYTIRAIVDNSTGGQICVADKLQTTATSEGVRMQENIGGTWGEYTVAIKP